MSFERASLAQRKPRIALPPPTIHSLLKKTSLTTKASASHEVRPAKPASGSPVISMNSKKRPVKELNSTLGPRQVPSLQLNLSINTSVTTPLSSTRTVETAATTRARPGVLGQALGIPSLNSSTQSSFSTATPKQARRSPSGSDIESQPEVAYPITPAQALKMYSGRLTDYEHGEILDVEQVYFLGLGAAKVRASSDLLNYGFDDDRGDYKIVTSDHINYRYEVLNLLGKGSFGQVCRCFDHKNKESIALKIIRNKRRFHQQGVVEVKVLDHLRTHDVEDKMCVVKMKSYFVFRKHLCLTFELLSINLYDFLKSNDFAGLSLNLIRRFAIQLIIALRYIKANHIIHCDLKPENILLKQPNKSGIKVIDLGSSCFENERVYTYIQSRFYRAPEIMLGIAYTPCIDIWSLGCILAELYTGYPLFPGESEQEQMLCIMEVLGEPPAKLLEASTRKKLFFDAANAPKVITNSRGKKRYPQTKTLASVLKSSDPAFTDFIAQCLAWDPESRLTPDQALKHQWIVEGIAKMQQAAEHTDRRRETPRSSDKSRSFFSGQKH